MPKMREYKFFKDDEEQTPIEILKQRSFKSAVKFLQSKVKDKKVIVEYITKKGKQLRRYVNLPIGRFKKIGQEMYNR